MSTTRARRIESALLVAIPGIVMFVACSDPARDLADARAADTSRAYEAFLDRHPDSPLAATARERLALLTAWENAAERDTAMGYREFLELHPGSELAERARAAIRALESRYQRECGAPRPFVVQEPRLVRAVDDLRLSSPNKFRLSQDEDGSLVSELGPGDSLAMLLSFGFSESRSTHWSTGTEITLVGDIDVGGGWVFRSSPGDPLVFRLDAGRGWVHLGGRGSISEDGRPLQMLPSFEPYGVSGPLLLQHAAEGSWARRTLALWSIGCSKTKGARPAVVESLGAEDWYVRRQAALTVMALEDTTEATELRALLDDENREVRRVAAESIGRLGDVRSESDLRARFEDDADLWVRIRAAAALHRIGHDQIDRELVQMLGSAEDDARFLAAHAMRLASLRGAVRDLEEAREKEEDRFVGEALDRALNELGADAGAGRQVAR